MSFTPITDKDKIQLKNKITASIYSYKRKKQRIRYSIGIAASIVVVIFISLYNYNTQSSSIDNFVKTVKNIDSENFDNVKLILTDNTKLEITEDNTTIKYSNSGQQVKIGSSKSINQSVVNNDKTAYNTLMVPYGRRSKIELSDGSMVWLNSGSKLVYPVAFNGNRREVYLEGEGIFEVAHDKDHPFIVVAENHEIEVLGTVFNVTNYTDENSIGTMLKSGSVQINYKGNSFFKPNEKIKILPGSLAVYNKNEKQITTKKVDVDSYFLWREGIFIFKSNNMNFIMKRLSRYYNVDIVIENKVLANQTFSGYLDLKENVENVVQIIQETTNFEYTKIGDTKIIIN